MSAADYAVGATSHAICFAVLARLLEYPDAELRADLAPIKASLPPEAAQRLGPLLAHLGQGELLELQEHYVATFDARAAHSLHLFEHIHGEARDRGQAMVDLRAHYERAGLAPAAHELPDYVPMFLEFLALADDAVAAELLGDAIHVLAALGERLEQAESPYACAFAQVVSMSDVTPEPIASAPAGDPFESEISFGPEFGLLQTQPNPPRQPAGAHHPDKPGQPRRPGVRPR